MPPPDQTPPDAILTTLAEAALAEGMRRAATEELRTPILVLHDGHGVTQRYAIKTPGVHPADAMRVLIYAHRATHAAYCFEGWAGDLSFEAGQVTREQAERITGTGGLPPGIPKPREHPDRFDALYLGAQGPDGQEIHRQWRITNGTPRTFEEDPRWDREFEHAPSNFWPLIAPYDDVRRLIRRYAELARLRDDVQSRRS